MSSITAELTEMDATWFHHTPYYCEENVYLLCKTLCKNGVADETGSNLFIVFISNEKKQASSPLASVKPVQDLMGLFCGIIMSSVSRFFRIVHAPLFFKHFASDRRHMKEPDGSWTAQPPPYQPIVAQDGILHNLSEYIAMSAGLHCRAWIPKQ